MVLVACVVAVVVVLMAVHGDPYDMLHAAISELACSNVVTQCMHQVLMSVTPR